MTEDPLPLLARLTERAAEAPDAPALVTPAGRVTTRAALVERARAVARGFVAAGLRPGDRVLFAVRPSVASVAAIVGLVHAGASIVALDVGGGDALFAARMRLVRPRWVLAESGLLAVGASALARRLLAGRGVTLPDLAPVRDLPWVRVGPPLPGAWRARALDALARHAPREGPEVAGGTAPAPDAEAFVVFTSGTTGAPRAVAHARRSLAATLAVVGELLAPDERTVAYARELHLILPTLLAGGRAVLPADGRFVAARARRDLARHGVTHAFLVTADAQALVDRVRVDGGTLAPSLRQLLLGAAPVHAAFLARLRAALPPTATATAVYGLTECLPVAATTLDEKLAWRGEGDLLGRPVPGVAVRLADDGELVVRAPHLCTGYLGEPPLAELRTGDLARVDVDGRLVLLGRRKEMIIRGRHNVYPALHEPVIARLPGVRRCAMVGVWDAAAADERIVLVVEPAPDAPEAAELAARVARALREGPSRIDADALPDRVLVHPLPEAGRSRKVDRAALERFAARALGLAS